MPFRSKEILLLFPLGHDHACDNGGCACDGHGGDALAKCDDCRNDGDKRNPVDVVACKDCAELFHDFIPDEVAE